MDQAERRAGGDECGPRVARDLKGWIAAKRASLLPGVSEKDVPFSPIVYFLQAETGQVKIGKTQGFPERISKLRTMSPVGLRLVGWVEDDGTFEHHLHWLLRDFRLHGEWFSPHPGVLHFARSSNDHTVESFRELLWAIMNDLSEEESVELKPEVSK